MEMHNAKVANYGRQSEPVHILDRVIAHEGIQIIAASLPDRISVYPPTDIRVVKTIAVIIVAGFFVLVLG